MAAPILCPVNSPLATRPGRRARLACECGLLYFCLPAADAAGWVPLSVIPLLLLMAGGCALALRGRGGRPALAPPLPAAEWGRMGLRFLLALPLLLGLLAILKPAALFALVRLHPGIWLLVMVAYPVLSVLPQEIIYRLYFFERYAPLFGTGPGLVAANAAAFGFGHVIFHNGIAVLLTVAGGWIFGQTYRRTRSWLLVSVEHALYGCALFTLGYGQFFYEGTLRLFKLAS